MLTVLDDSRRKKIIWLLYFEEAYFNRKSIPIKYYQKDSFSCLSH